uniref:Uncharacterized protein n=1 Tax=Anguilla anguilla TaxID=7936 RepID=A0A0E9PYM9_ANGAN
MCSPGIYLSLQVYIVWIYLPITACMQF